MLISQNKGLKNNKYIEFLFKKCHFVHFISRFGLVG